MGSCNASHVQRDLVRFVSVHIVVHVLRADYFPSVENLHGDAFVCVDAVVVARAEGDRDRFARLGFGRRHLEVVDREIIVGLGRCRSLRKVV